MSGPDICRIAEIAGGSIGAVAGALVAYWRIRDKKQAKRYGLGSNPTRCGEMKARIEILETTVSENNRENRGDHKEMLRQIGALSVDIAKLGKNGG